MATTSAKHELAITSANYIVHMAITLAYQIIMAITSAMGKQKCPLATSGGGTTPHGTTSAKQYTNINMTITSVTKNNTKM